VGYVEINAHFEHENRDKKMKNKKKYNQYITILVFCKNEKITMFL